MARIDLDRVSLTFKIRQYNKLTLKEFLVRRFRREKIALAIPPSLRSAAAAGIGLLLTFIGLRNTGLIVSDPATIVRVGTLDHRAALLLLGILVAVALMRRNNPLAFLAAIFSATAIAWLLGYEHPPERLVSAPVRQ